MTNVELIAQLEKDARAIERMADLWTKQALFVSGSPLEPTINTIAVHAASFLRRLRSAHAVLRDAEN